MTIPASLARLANTTSGRSWLSGLPGVVEHCAAKWGLTVGDAYADSWVSLTLPAITEDGGKVVLKIQYPDPESEAEADALRLWDGDGVIRLIAESKEHRALLLEWCDPGHHLSSAGPEVALRVISGLLPRLWVAPAGPFRSLSDEVERWVANLPAEYEGAGEPFERALLDDVMTMLLELASSQGEQVLLHQDLHGDNVLSSQREPWLVIDPKPLVGEREFSLSPVIRSAELGHSKEHVIWRLDRLTGQLGLDRNRTRLWAAGQAVAWGFEAGQVLPGHIEMARWLLSG